MLNHDTQWTLRIRQGVEQLLREAPLQGWDADLLYSMGEARFAAGDELQAIACWLASEELESAPEPKCIECGCTCASDELVIGLCEGCARAEWLAFKG